MWKFASYEFSGNLMSISGRCTTNAAIRMRLIGRGRDDGATDSILSTVPFQTKPWIFYQEDFRFNDTQTGCLFRHISAAYVQ